MSKDTLISHNAAETEALGEAWGRAAQPGWVLGLSGDLGAGKTQLVRGLARGLGVTARISSPTFALVNEYGGGRLPLSHIDLYRLETERQIIGAGLEEYLRPAGVTVIEWIERWESLLKTSHATGAFRCVWIEVLEDGSRRIAYEDSGT
ncbi:MAG: tRNA (adenosine(37)-N6)-threonylcarbamoyltransferase complex ATPase subunit type 1 TsaE [Pedosphaera sp.]|nr:tRNA (adenosine(37)-N6)-threonylcarbamoyltransferase complex ATPase subunit type 1 TsaE [Pedosphaera sp.]